MSASAMQAAGPVQSALQTANTIFTSKPMQMGLSAAGTTFSALGKMQEGRAAFNQGVAQNESDQFESAELNNQANNVMGQASAQAANQDIQNKLVMSAQRARAAGNTGSVAPGAATLVGQTAARGEYDILSELATGGMQAAGLKTQAGLDTFMGSQAYQAGVARRKAADMAAAGTIFQGATSLYTKYGMGGPPDPGAVSPINNPENKFFYGLTDGQGNPIVYGSPGGAGMGFPT